MNDGLLPLFPLELVLLPHETIPLHVFEERYKEMIGECLRLEAEFGVVQARDNGIVRTGCTAVVAKVTEQYEDGRMDILIRGQRRFRIRRLDTERAFVRAEVEYFWDEERDATDASLVRRALAAYLLYAEATGREAGKPVLDEPDLSFRLSAISTDRDFRQYLLDLSNERERLMRTADHLERGAARKKIETAIKKTARSNGHGKHLGTLSE
jgi:Lon protease-like protein